ncbi:MAG: sortase [Jatrophihabitantaceae bacterium]
MRTKVLATALTLALLGGVGFWTLHQQTPTHPEAAPTTSPVPLPKPAQLVKAAPSKPAVPHEAVAPAAPTAFELTGRAFTIKANVCQMDNVRPLDPPGDQFHTVCWVRQGFGVAPGSSSGGTSYILGHAWAEATLVLNPLSLYAMKDVTGHASILQDGVPIFPITRVNGYHVVLHTPDGVLTYKVTTAFAVAKERAADVKALMANTPNRVVLITCGVANGADIDVNVVVYAMLESSVRT